MFSVCQETLYTLYINSANLYNNPMKQVLLLFLNLHMKITEAQKGCKMWQDITPSEWWRKNSIPGGVPSDPVLFLTLSYISLILILWGFVGKSIGDVWT